MISLNRYINVILISSLFVFSEFALGKRIRTSVTRRFVRILGIHRQVCGEPPAKQVWYKRGKFKSTCPQVTDDELNKYINHFEDVEILGKNIYILKFSKRLDDYILNHAIFTDNGTWIWRKHVGYQEISIFCKNNQASLCDSFLLNKVKYYPLLRSKK